MRFLSVALFLFIVGQAATASAQWGRGWGRGWGGGGYRHASTAAEGAMRGMGDLVRSQGAYNLMTSRSLQNVEAARAQNIENRVRGTEAYFQMRQMNREYRAAEARPRPTQEDVVRYAEMRSPKRLGATEMDPLTGQISWPIVLTDPMFDDYRAKIEELYGERAHHGNFTIQQLTEVDRLSKEMTDLLVANLDKFPSQAYTQAKSFLNSLHYEAIHQAG